MKGINELKTKYGFPKEIPTEKPDYHGWFKSANSALLRMILTKNTKVVVELGSLFGLSARNMHKFAPNATIICIDTWKGNPGWIDCSYFDDLDMYKTFLSSCWDFQDRIIPMKEDSQKGMKILSELGIKPDLIYIDASHEYQDVVDDIVMAKELFPNAFICGDDYLKPDVLKAVNENGNYNATDNFWWYQ